jgi:prepilin-type N-terminal cleavage/methylation domain-containing protein
MARTRPHGFTLIELAVVVAIMAITAAFAVSYARAGLLNANVSTAAHELSVRIAGLRDTAMSEGADHLLVVVDAKDNDATGCRFGALDSCVRAFVLREPAAAWALSDFDPDDPAEDASYVEALAFGRGVAFDLVSSPSRPAPFASVPLRDPELTSTCPTNRKCFAVRFRTNGEIVPEYSGSSRPRKQGYAFALGSTSDGNDRRAMIVSFPTGIVKTVAF